MLNYNKTQVAIKLMKRKKKKRALSLPNTIGQKSDSKETPEPPEPKISRSTRMEIFTLSSCRHPNIVNFIDAYACNNNIWV